MPVNTVNTYGKITISNDAIASVTSHIARDCYGVIDVVNQNFFDSVSSAVKKNPKSKGIKIVTVGNRIFININVILKYGVSISIGMPSDDTIWAPSFINLAYLFPNSII